MTPTVGIFYSVQEFLRFIRDNEIARAEIGAIEFTFGVVSIEEVLFFADSCQWIRTRESGFLCPTVSGERVLEQSDYRIQLRCQLEDYIHIYKPAWGAKIRAGRSETMAACPDVMHQVFREANLLEDIDFETISWWDRTAIRYGVIQNETNLLIGRKAERLSLDHEKERTGKMPNWVSVESNYAGYDILSYDNVCQNGKLKIEVKGSDRPLNDAYFYVTKHEWNTASNDENYIFHLWLTQRVPPKLKIANFAEVLVHMPLDQTDGEWQSTKIPFKSFDWSC